MTIGVIATIFSTIFLTVMVVADRLMIGDCFEDNPTYAWIISAIAGCLFGMLATVLLWLFFITTTTHTALEVLSGIPELFFPYGLLILLSGILSIQTLKHYFECFSVGGESTAIAGWLAATPIIVLSIISVIHVLHDSLPFIHTWNLEQVNIGYEFVIFSIVATLALISFEIFTSESSNSNTSSNYLKPVTLMLIANAMYAVIIHVTINTAILQTNIPSGLMLVTLLPFYWIGFLAGVRPLIKKFHRDEFKRRWGSRIKYYLPAILFTEVIGMLVFFTEFFGLGTTDPTFVSIIIGSHIILVYLIMKGLSILRYVFEKRSQEIWLVFGMQVTVSRLPYFKIDLKYILIEIFLLFLVAAALYHLTQVVLL